MQDFAKEALFAKHPIDLGTRCTVFMNSKVKQAQKEGATLPIFLPVLPTLLLKMLYYKVIKTSMIRTILESISLCRAVRFYNDAVLRSFEKITGVDAVRPDIAGIMGAFGAALIAREQL